ncbi:MAG: monofunctional biosynthetic peptidoglycan transglycosylase [Prevotella sp.]|nr:monofunctional biosynthetic peptidoglycan transglycosylase [Bacteroidales bacterium]MDY4951045.1 monofunctional biosynthetic peptidoglycan transglycosylase [Prevotella sp.]MDY5321479.1 monofunctional biosynthetic peptidoglycan transglycosylase [Prevotella sp.]
MKLLKKIVGWGLSLFLASSILAVVVYKFLPVYVTPLMVIRLFQQAGEGESLKWHHTWVSMDEISPHMPVAVMASEDQRFLLHHGFDVNAIEKAARNNINGGRIHGGSTISQQTAKNVFLWPGRSWVRKGFEAYFTFLIELMWSKQRIMEVYLNSIEMGDGIYGVEACAEHHFDKEAIDLTRPQCALIAATLPNPRKFSSKDPSPYIKRRSVQIQHQMQFIPSFPKEGEDFDPNTSSGGVYRNHRKK